MDSTPEKKTKDPNQKSPKSPKNPVIEQIENNNILLSEDNFIGISGIIGAGKTTLAAALGKVMNLPVYYEPIVENEYLTDFYRDMKRYSFSFQIYLLNVRFRQHQQVLWNGTGGIQDRTLYEDSIFAKVLYEDGNMEEREYKTYLNLFRNMSNFMKKNTLKAVFSMPDDIFYPTGTNVCVMVWEAHTPHDSTQETFFGYCKEDGFVKRKKLGRIDALGKWESIEKEW